MDSFRSSSRISRLVISSVLLLVVFSVPLAFALTTIITTVDSTGLVGEYTSTAIGADNYPIVSYYSSTTGDLKVTKCGNTSCSSGNTTTTVDSTGNVGQYTSIAIGADNYPVISYLDVSNNDLKVTKCGNASCSSGNTTTTIDSTGSVGQYSSIAIGADDYPVISYYDTTNADLKVVKCGDASCSSGNTTTTVDSTGLVGTFTSIAIGADDYPVISYYDTTSADLKVTKCGDASCSSGNTTTTVDSTNSVGQYSSIAIGADDYPVISYLYASGNDLKVTKCGNASCSSSNTTTTIDSTGNVGLYTSIAIGSDEFPVISHFDNSNSDLRVVKCGNASCSSSNTITTIDSTGNVGTHTSIKCGTDNYPVISYYDSTNSDLKVAQIADATYACGTLSSDSSPSSGGGGTAFWLLKLRQENGLSPDGHTVISSDSSSSSLSFSSSTSSSTENFSSISSSDSSSSSSSSISSSASQTQRAPTPVVSPLEVRTCARVSKAFAKNIAVLERLNRRLLARYGFTCGE